MHTYVDGILDTRPHGESISRNIFLNHVNGLKLTRLRRKERANPNNWVLSKCYHTEATTSSRQEVAKNGPTLSNTCITPALAHIV
jgi:hypothetical protein